MVVSRSSVRPGPNARLASQTYTVFAIKGSVTVSTTVVVNDDGTVGTVATLDLTPPPPPVP